MRALLVCFIFRMLVFFQCFFWKILCVLTGWIFAACEKWSFFTEFYLHNSFTTFFTGVSSIFCGEFRTFKIAELSNPFYFWVETRREKRSKSTSTNNNSTSCLARKSIIFILECLKFWIHAGLKVFTFRISGTSYEFATTAKFVDEFFTTFWTVFSYFVLNFPLYCTRSFDLLFESLIEIPEHLLPFELSFSNRIKFFFDICREFIIHHLLKIF